jgi:hypothetical protein
MNDREAADFVYRIRPFLAQLMGEAGVSGGGAGSGGVYTPLTRQIFAGSGLTQSRTDLAADMTINAAVANTGAVGLTVEADAIRLTSSSNPGAAAVVLATDANGHMTIVRATATERVRTPLIDTASGALAISPAGALTLTPGNGVVNLTTGILQSSNYASQTTGFGITHAGAADFRYLFVDEMHAKSFIADLEQALAGGQIISKSVALMGKVFTAPAAGATATLWVRDLPSAANMAAFQSGDIVRVRTFLRSGGSLSISDCWGVVTAYADGTGADEGLQSWTFTRSSAPNAGAMTAGTTVQPDAIVLDYGTSGNGIYEVNAIDGAYGANSPYAQIVQWTGHPATGSVVRARYGKLDGWGGGYAGTNTFGIVAGNVSATWIAAEATNGFRVMNGTTVLGQWDTAGNMQLGQVAASKANIYFDVTSGELRFRTNTTAYFVVRSDGRLAFAQGAAAANSVNWEMSNGETVSQVFGYRGGGRSYATLIAYGYSGAAGITELIAYTPNNSSGFARLWLDGNAKQIIADNVIVANAGVSATSVTASGDLTAAGAVYASNWLRTYGATGWYSQDYGGGWHMSDTTWVRSYNGKAVYTSNIMRADGGFQASGTGQTVINGSAQHVSQGVTGWLYVQTGVITAYDNVGVLNGSAGRTTGTYTIDLQSGNNGSMPAGVKAVGVRFSAVWANAANNGAMTMTYGGVTLGVCRAQVNSRFSDGYCVLPADGNGDISFSILNDNSSGVVVALCGYFI